MGIVPVTYSTNGEAPVSNSVTSVSFTLPTVDSTPVPSPLPSNLPSSDHPNFNIHENNSATTNLMTNSLSSLPMDDLLEVPNSESHPSFALYSSAFPSPCLSSSLSEATSQTPTSEASSISNVHITVGLSRPLAQQAVIEAHGGRYLREENLIESLIEEQSTPLMTSTPLTTAQVELEPQVLLSRDEERKVKEEHILQSGKVPVAGVVIPKGQLRRAGPYLLGPCLGSSPVRSIVQCLARRENTDNFFTLKILTVRDASDETQDDRQGKMLLHTEHSLLSLLSGQRGVIQHHGLFEDYACGAREQSGGTLVATGRLVRRVCLVLDCVTPQDYCPHTNDLINLQHYVITKKKLLERDALTIFYNIVSVVHSLHEQNIVHRDLKLGNLVLHRTTRDITITNFCLGQHLPSEKDRLRDQRGSPAYISPDVLSSKPYLGKPSDMWALGVVLFTMLYGHFPFYDASPQELFRKIKAAQYTLPKGDKLVKETTKDVIRGLLVLDPVQRFTCKQVLSRLTSIISSPIIKNPQVVPEVGGMEEDKTTSIKGTSNDLQTKDGSLNCDSLDNCFRNGINISNRVKRSGDKDGENQAKYNLDHLLLQVAQQDEEGSHIANHKSGVKSSNSSVSCTSNNSSNKPNGMISCIVGDARPLTQVEFSSLRHILPHTSRLNESVTRSCGPPPSVAVVVSRSSNDRFSSLFSPRSTGARNFPINLLRSPVSNHTQPPPNVTIPPAPLPPHVLSSHLSSPLSHLPPTNPRMTLSSSHPVSSNSVIPTFGVFSNSVQSQSSQPRGPHPPAPSTGSRTRWTPGIHSRIVHNISSLQHIASSTGGQEETLQISSQDIGENHQSEEFNNSELGTPSLSSSQPPRGPLRLLERSGRGQAGSAMSRRTFRPVRRYR